MSRARWLAFGSTLVGIGCNGSLAAELVADGGAASDDAETAHARDDATTEDVAPNDVAIANDASSADDRKPDDDAHADAARGEAGYSSPDRSCPRHGTFACGSMSCDRATQVCFNSQCTSLASADVQRRFVDSGACLACPSCACIPNQGDCNRGLSCFEDNFGGLTVTCSQGGCYGSPPARLDRLPFLA
jgi:hypothetical protein